MKDLPLIIFWITILFGCSFESKQPAKSSEQAKPTATAKPELKIHDGQPSFAEYVVGVVGSKRCSGIVLKDRCVLTVRHCVMDGTSPITPWFVTDDSTVLNASGLLGNNRTGVAKVVRKSDGGSSSSEYYKAASDLAMLWLAPHVCDGPDVPEDCDNPKSWTVGGWEEIPSNEIDDLEDESVWARGYGLKTAAPSPSSAPGDLSRGAGRMVIDDPYFLNVSGLGVAAQLIDDSTYGGDHFACAGDSGGAIASGNIAGNYPFGLLAASSAGSACAGENPTSYAIIFTDENADWIEEQVENFCIDTIKVKTEADVNEGRVIGMVGEPETKVIDCGANAEAGYGCAADVSEDITLTATPNAGWAFDGWEPGTGCPCDNENPCEISANDRVWTYEDNNGTDPAVNVSGPEVTCNPIFSDGY